MDNWKEHSYLSLCGTSDGALLKMLEGNKYDEIILCLDNDYVGQKAVMELKEKLIDYEVSVIVPRFKDFNEDLKFKNNQPVIPSIIESFMVQINENKLLIIKQSVNEKDKTIKDLFESVSIFRGNINSQSKVWKARAVASLLLISRDAIFIARQQYRHFEMKYTLQKLVDKV